MSDRAGKRPILGWNVGGTTSSVVVGSEDGTIAERASWPSEAQKGPGAMIPEFLRRARALAERHPGVRGLGVSIGGPLNTLTGAVLSPVHLPGWDDVPLAEDMRRELGLPVTVEHDAAACLEAEWLWGAARGATHAAYLTCGTGCGAGVLLGGRILRGPRGESPEIGHVRLAPDGPDMFGKRGCVESFCSGEGIAKLAAYRFPDRFAGPTATEELKRLADAGDGPAREVLEESARRTGQLCSILADLFAPEVIVLGSLARYLGTEWQEKIREEFRRESLEINARRTRILPSALGERLQDLSAIAPVIFGEPAAGPAA